MPRNGLRSANAMAWPALRPNINALGSPGPRVAATARRSSAVTSAARNASWVTGRKLRRCSRVANSGTTPPYSAWSRAWEETMFDKTRPSRTTAALVSSQEVLLATSVIFLEFQISDLKFEFGVTAPGCLWARPELLRGGNLVCLGHAFL